jgi:fumarate hydratase subunit alpha
MREISSADVAVTVARLCIEAAHDLPADVEGALRIARTGEASPLGIIVLDQILENAEIARAQMVPLCQDTGVTVVMLEVGQDVHIRGDYLHDAIAEGVRRGYREGHLRASIVERPFSNGPTCTRSATPI